MLYAAVLLRRGIDLDSVERTTGVPVALLELLHAELADPDEDPDHYRWRRRRSAWAWRTVVLLVMIEVAAAGTAALCVAALLQHRPALSQLCATLAVALLTVLWLLARSLSPTLNTPTITRWRPPHPHHDQLLRHHDGAAAPEDDEDAPYGPAPQ